MQPDRWCQRAGIGSVIELKCTVAPFKYIGRGRRFMIFHEEGEVCFAYDHLPLVYSLAMFRRFTCFTKSVDLKTVTMTRM